MEFEVVDSAWPTPARLAVRGGLKTPEALLESLLCHSKVRSTHRRELFGQRIENRAPKLSGCALTSYLEAPAGPERKLTLS